jgi:autotransporter-associated beta strand protein
MLKRCGVSARLQCRAWLVFLVCCDQSVLATEVVWDGSSSSAWLTGTNWVSDATPSATDVAVFSSSSTPGTSVSTGVGISLSGATNNGANNQAVAAVKIGAGRGSNALFIGNSSTSANGTLTLSGGTVTAASAPAGVPHAIFVLGSSGNVTVHNTAGSGNKTMGVNLATAGSNVILFDGPSGTLEIKSAVTGIGGVEIQRSSSSSSSKLLLTGANTYAGDTILTSGRVRSGGFGIPNGPGTGNLFVNTGAWFESLADETINGLSGGGLIDNANTAATPITLSVGDNNATSTFSGTLANTSANLGSILNLNKIGGGTLTLTGNNTYRGLTTVTEGTLNINGTHVNGLPYSVAAAGTMSGSGVILTAVSLNGTISPGDSVGTLSMSRLDVNDGATFNFQLNPTNTTAGGGVNDLLNVTGLLNLTEKANTLHFNVQKIGAADFDPLGTWTLASYSALRVTGFSGFDPRQISVTGLTGFTPSLNLVPLHAADPYGPGVVKLSLSSAPPPITPIQASFSVRRDVFIPNTDPLVAPKSEMHATGPGLERIEYLYFLSGQADTYTNSGYRLSDDNGRTWGTVHPMPNSQVFYTTPSGSQVNITESEHEPIYDPTSGLTIQPWLRIIPSNGVNYYHTYFRVSSNRGVVWSTPKMLKWEAGPEFNPADPLNTGHLFTNIGIRGQSFYALKNGSVLVGIGGVPDPNDPQSIQQTTRFGALNIVGRWNPNTQDYDWQTSNRVSISPTLSSRGLLEPDMAQLNDGRILTIWRGSNSTTTPGRKWYTVSSEDGLTLSAPLELKYDDGTSFFSPSAMHMLERNSVNGKLYWFGNIAPFAPSGNLPRYPLVIAEVDEDLLALKRNTVTIIADLEPGESVSTQYSNFTVFENPETHVFELYLTNLGAGTGQYDADALRFTINVLPVPVPLPGDYDNDGTVDAADYVVWRRNVGVSITLPNETVSPGAVDGADYDEWRSHFGTARSSGAVVTAVPEPSGVILIWCSCLVGCVRRCSTNRYASSV